MARRRFPALGIDLGTTHSCIAYMDPDQKKPRVIKMRNDDHTIPSVVAFGKSGRTIGANAKIDVSSVMRW